MNKVTVAVGAGALAVVLAGCGPELAQTSFGEKEEQWQRVIRDNYPQYDPPRTAPPAVRDNVSPRLREAERQRENARVEAQAGEATGAPAADDDPDVTVDRAAEQTSAKAEAAPEKSGKAAPAAEKGSADKSGAKAAPKAERSVSGEEYVVKSGDNLGKIAQKFYGDARRADVIVRANPKLTDPNRLRVGTKLVIPKI